MTMQQLLLLMPNRVENITVRIVGKLQELDSIPINTSSLGSRSGSILSNEKYKGSGLFIPVNIFGDDEKNIFMMELERTLWKSLHEEILNNSLTPDRELICLNRKIITIWNMAGISNGIFEVKMRYDIESAELRGEEHLEGVIKREIDENKLAYKCLIRNLERIENKNVSGAPGVKNNKLFLKVMDLRREWLRRIDEQDKSQRPPIGWPKIS